MTVRLLVLYLLLSVSFAQVTNLNDAGAGSLRDVVAAANNGDTITFQAGLSGTINLTSGEIEIDENNLTINGAGTSITLDGQSANRIFNHTGNGTLTVNNLTFQNGNDGGNSGGAIRSASNLVVSGSTFRNNTSTINTFPRGGGALYAETSITVDNSTFTDNTAIRGGAIISRGSVTITSSTITGNTATRFGGGVYGNGVTTITSSILSGNRITNTSGGGLYSNANVTISNSLVSGNSAVFGGGIFVIDSRNLTLNNTTVTGNQAQNYGGGTSVAGGGTFNNSLV